MKVLEAIEAEKGKRGRKPPFTLGQAIILMAKQSGYLARPSDPPPGAEFVWKGMIRLYDDANGFRLATAQSRPP